MVVPQRPSGVNVGVNNPGTIVYIVGNETTDGSIRWHHDVLEEFSHIEKRADGVWNDTGLRISPSTLLLGRGFKLQAASSQLLLAPQGSDRQIVVASEFNDTGSRPPHVDLLGSRINRLVVQPDESLEQSFAVHVGTAIIGTVAFGHAVYFKVGSVGATAPVTFRSSEGVPPDDVIFIEKVFPASDFPANTEIRLDLESGVAIPLGAQVNPRLISDNPFSVKYNAAGTRFWTAVDTQSKTSEDLLSFPTGFDRILMSNAGEHIASNAGNFVIREAA